MKHRTLFLGTSLAAATLVGCMQDNASNGDAGADGGSLANCQSDYGSSTAAQQIEAFSAAVSSFSSQAAELDTTLRTECRAIAIDLGAQPSEVMATATETETAVACRRAAELIRAETAAVRGSAGVTLTLQVRPPRCTVDVDAYSQCVATCDVTYQPATARITCEGGELRGGCSGSCTGSCAATATATCSGACEGTCAGSCTGTCAGACDGVCSARDASGNCNGMCTGTCSGTCSAGCTGTCTGQCVTAASARCEGECRGTCSVAFTEPRCTGRAVPPMVDADCRASCDTRVNAAARCTPGAVVLRVDGTLEGALQTRADRLRATLEAHYGNIASAGVRLRALTDAGVLVAQSSQRVPGAVVTLGVGAVACSASAAREFAASVPRVQVSLQASVSVSGAVTSG